MEKLLKDTMQQQHMMNYIQILIIFNGKYRWKHLDSLKLHSHDWLFLKILLLVTQLILVLLTHNVCDDKVWQGYCLNVALNFHTPSVSDVATGI